MILRAMVLWLTLHLVGMAFGWCGSYFWTSVVYGINAFIFIVWTVLVELRYSESLEAFGRLRTQMLAERVRRMREKAPWN